MHGQKNIKQRKRLHSRLCIERSTHFLILQCFYFSSRGYSLSNKNRYEFVKHIGISRELIFILICFFKDDLRVM